MTSVLNVDTIADKAGTGPVGLTKQTTIKVFYDSKTTFGTADKSFGLSSSSDAGTGQTGLNFTNAFDGPFYAAAGMLFDTDGSILNEQSLKVAGSCEIRSYGGLNGGGTASAQDKDIEIMITGDLA